ncbi:hypothetical protein EC12264_2217 [Escherichia coli 1.2264]|nr:hypothetical protein EC12264_2217 [Escherichia coli 1.2264]
MPRIIELRQQKTAIKNQMRDMLENAEKKTAALTMQRAQNLTNYALKLNPSIKTFPALKPLQTKSAASQVKAVRPLTPQNSATTF